MELNPREMDPKSCYKLVIGCVVPRPIAVVSTVSPAGVLNIAPFSYFTIASHTPLRLAFTVGGPKGDGSMKDTLRNAQPVEAGGIGEFVVNLADESYAESMAATGESLPFETSEFAHAGLTPAPSRTVRPPRIGESSVAFECRTTHVIAIGDSRLVIGEVRHIHVRDGLADDRMHVDPARLAAIGRMAGNDYVRTRDRFEIPTRGR